MQNFFGLATFAHLLDPGNSAYLMVNRSNSVRGGVTEMQQGFSDLYPEMFDLSFSELWRHLDLFPIFIPMISGASERDRELFVKIAAGDETAFGELFYSYLPRLTPFIDEMVKSEAVTAELIQDVFVRVWLNRDRLPAIKNPRAWIYKIAAHLTYNQLNRIANERRVLAEVARTTSPEDLGTHGQLGLRELRSVIAEAVRELPERRRLVYELSRRDGLSLDEIAARLNISPNTVKNTLVNALAFIRERLEKTGYLLPAIILSWLL